TLLLTCSPTSSSIVANPPSLFLCLFFQCTRPHRHLHPFPTRRSSDLADRLQPDLLMGRPRGDPGERGHPGPNSRGPLEFGPGCRSEEHTSELQSRSDLVCRLLLEKKKNIIQKNVQELYCETTSTSSSM